MKSSFCLLTLASFLCLPVMNHAADKKPAAKNQPAAKKLPPAITVDTAAVDLLRPYDKDANYEISEDELKAIQADYKASPKGPLYTLDITGDRAFDDFDRMNMNNKLGAAKMVEKPAPPVKPAKKK